MNTIKHLQVAVVIVLVGYISSSDLLEETENGPLQRYKRAWSNEKKKVKNCAAGEKAVIECVKCPVGYYTPVGGLWRDCVRCPKGKTSLEHNPNKCVTKCPAGKTWNLKKKKCTKCPANTFKADAGNHPCTQCPTYWKPNTRLTSCNKLICPAGYEPRTLPDDSMTCAPCKFGFYKKTSGGSTVSCVPCPDGRWTLTTGAKSQAKCIAEISDPACNAGYPALAHALEAVAYDMTKNDTLGDVLCETSDGICKLLDDISTCSDVTDTSTGQPILPVHQDHDKSINLTTVVTHTPWCVTIFTPGTSSSSYWSSSSSIWSSNAVLGWSWMFGERGTSHNGGGSMAADLRMGDPTVENRAWWNEVASGAATASDSDKRYSSSSGSSSGMSGHAGPTCIQHGFKPLSPGLFARDGVMTMTGSGADWSP